MFSSSFIYKAPACLSKAEDAAWKVVILDCNHRRVLMGQRAFEPATPSLQSYIIYIGRFDKVIRFHPTYSRKSCIMLVFMYRIIPSNPSLSKKDFNINQCYVYTT